MRFNFLVYAARSGSTLLARRLAMRSPDLLVVPEFRLVEFLLARGNPAVERLSPVRLRGLLGTDIQLTEALMLTSSDLDDIARSNAGAGVRPLVTDIVTRYGRRIGVDAGACVIKIGSALQHYRRLAIIFPEARFVHIIRDGRGVMNSLLNTERAFYANEDMGRSDPYHCVRLWTSQLRTVQRVGLRHELPVLEVGFEELVADESAALVRIGTFLDISIDLTTTATPAFDVGESEQRIHGLLRHEPAVVRAEGWKIELTPWKGMACEVLGAEFLTHHGYEPWFTRGVSRSARYRAVARALLVHVVATPRWLLRRLWLLRRDPRVIWEHAILVLRRIGIR